MNRISNLLNCPKPIGPYSTAIISNSMLYVSGQIGVDPSSGKLVSGGAVGEVTQILKNLEQILASTGLSPSDIVMTSIFLIQMSDFQALNQVYGQWVSSEMPPARQTVAVKELPAGASVEISIIAEIV